MFASSAHVAADTLYELPPSPGTKFAPTLGHSPTPERRRMTPTICVGELMTSPVITADRNELLTVADDRMKSDNIRHIVVVNDDGEVAGVVSQRDLFLGGLMRALGYGTYAKDKALDSLSIKEAMSSDPVTVCPETPIEEAGSLLLEKKLGCLPVVDGNSLVGILTESDFVSFVVKGSTAR